MAIGNYSLRGIDGMLGMRLPSFIFVFLLLFFTEFGKRSPE